MRIGTWNLEGKWSADHLAFMVTQACDVWLLTEVPVEASLPGMAGHRTMELMTPGRCWATIFSRWELEPEPDPHRATAMARGNGVRFMSSVLPWRSCGASWEGSELAERMSHTLAPLRRHLKHPTVWGGDWNQAMEGREYVGSTAGRDEILDLLDEAQLSVPTRSLGSAVRGQRSIDHVAVPLDWEVSGAYRLRAAVDGRRLSDHDAYVVAVDG